MSVLANSSGLRAVISLLSPPVCSVCAMVIGPGEYLCRGCEEKSKRIVPPFCAKCSEPFDGAIIGQFTCAICAHRTIHFDAAVAAYRRRVIVREFLPDLKYGRH